MEKQAHQKTCQEFEAFKQSIAAEAGVERPIVGPSIQSPDDVELYYSI